MWTPKDSSSPLLGQLQSGKYLNFMLLSFNVSLEICAEMPKNIMGAD